MLIGIISDTHENMPIIDKAVEIFNSKNVKLVFHAGDIISPITYLHFSKLACPIHLVYGNNDGEKKFLKEKYSQIGSIQDPPLEYAVKENGKVIQFVIYHALPDDIDYIIKSGKYDYIIYGHTHKKDLRTVDNTTIINPGEAGGWLYNERTIVILDTETKKIEFVNL